jgi:hypothetical protein
MYICMWIEAHLRGQQLDDALGAVVLRRLYICIYICYLDGEIHEQRYICMHASAYIMHIALLCYMYMCYMHT